MKSTFNEDEIRIAKHAGASPCKELPCKNSIKLEIKNAAPQIQEERQYFLQGVREDTIGV